MKRLVVAVVSAVSLGLGSYGLVPLSASAAPLANPGCMSRAEFHRIKLHMTHHRVTDIVGSPGKPAPVGGVPEGESVLMWKKCGNPGAVAMIEFRHERVKAKYF